MVREAPALAILTQSTRSYVLSCVRAYNCVDSQATNDGFLIFLGVYVLSFYPDLECEHGM